MTPSVSTGTSCQLRARMRVRTPAMPAPRLDCQRAGLHRPLPGIVPPVLLDVHGLAQSLKLPCHPELPQNAAGLGVQVQALPAGQRQHRAAGQVQPATAAGRPTAPVVGTTAAARSYTWTSPTSGATTNLPAPSTSLQPHLHITASQLQGKCGCQAPHRASTYNHFGRCHAGVDLVHCWAVCQTLVM